VANAWFIRSAPRPGGSWCAQVGDSAQCFARVCCNTIHSGGIHPVALCGDPYHLVAWCGTVHWHLLSGVGGRRTAVTASDRSVRPERRPRFRPTPHQHVTLRESTGVTGPVPDNYFFTTLTGPGNATTGVAFPTRAPVRNGRLFESDSGWGTSPRSTSSHVFDITMRRFVERLENQSDGRRHGSPPPSLPSTSASAQSQGTLIRGGDFRSGRPTVGSRSATSSAPSSMRQATVLLSIRTIGSGRLQSGFLPRIDATDDPAGRQRASAARAEPHVRAR